GYSSCGTRGKSDFGLSLSYRRDGIWGGVYAGNRRCSAGFCRAGKNLIHPFPVNVIVQSYIGEDDGVHFTASFVGTLADCAGGTGGAGGVWFDLARTVAAE